MASLARTAARLSARRLIIDRHSQQQCAGFRTSAAALAAQNFTMPALSPTMTQGNIAKWKVKEGESFAAGDVLLEIETDKASMDVEAQDDGVLAKITSGDGAQNILVGSRIGVLAEPGDDLASLEIPPEQPPASSSSSPSSSAPKQEEKKEAKPQQQSPPKKSPTTGGQKNPPQKYPLYPSVEHLVKEHKLDEAAIRAITPTGPQGRLLKGDVLAYLGTISAERPAEIKTRFDHHAHLDLSNIKVAPAKEAPREEKKKPAGAGEGEAKRIVPELSISLPVSLSAVVEVQKKVEAALGTFLPLSTFVARAVDAANDGLPLPRGYQPSADELFNQVLGLDKVSGRKGSGSSRGHYLPQLAALNPSFTGVAPKPKPASRPQKGLDVIDFLAGGSAAAKKSSAAAAAGRRSPAPRLGVSASGPNALTLTAVPRAEERRAKEFLQRVKAVLENDPGRLVL
ncbi:pyridoxine biosynthesis protein [Diatrype stigma]|uniref:Pyridoxine biosynthesis protein n=1 Tax=Diatrype stigma TaxID=117547 RepID=A0AAN9UZQ9_9PEZI